MICPKPLQRGDSICVVAPSGPFDEDAFEAGKERLEAHFELIVAPRLSQRRAGFLAGTDEERRAELQAAFDHPSARAIWIARGGYGITRILPSLRWESLLRTPKWIVGFSDVTALHLAAAQRGMLSLHGPHLTTLGRASEADFERLLELLIHPERTQTYAGLKPLTTASTAPEQRFVRGPLVGGNLTVLFSEAAAGSLRIPEGALLFLEDVTETSYRVDRMLTALLRAGHLRNARALLLGDFTDCSPGRFGPTVDAVLEERLGQLGVPVLRGLPLGHGEAQSGILHGGEAELDLVQGLLRVSPHFLPVGGGGGGLRGGATGTAGASEPRPKAEGGAGGA